MSHTKPAAEYDDDRCGVKSSKAIAIEKPTRLIREITLIVIGLLRFRAKISRYLFRKLVIGLLSLLCT